MMIAHVIGGTIGCDEESEFSLRYTAWLRHVYTSDDIGYFFASSLVDNVSSRELLSFLWQLVPAPGYSIGVVKEVC